MACEPEASVFTTVPPAFDTTTVRVAGSDSVIDAVATSLTSSPFGLNGDGATDT